MTIRRGEPADAPVAAEVWLRSRKASVPAIPAPVHDDDEVRAYFAGHVVGNCELWLAEDAGAVVGVLVLGGDWVDQLYVDPSRWGRGIGSALLDVAKRERPGGLRLWTFAGNSGARRFYERHGFVEGARTDGDNEEGAPDVLYVFSAVARGDVRPGQ
ncbi:MAG TPA: GNAT family N-acetyltransferase [Solirubrobacteraceae bacterium]|nr:GNAT family N-acetyltransferase [Solirubrobacteraceae bacterium]